MHVKNWGKGFLQDISAPEILEEHVPENVTKDEHDADFSRRTSDVGGEGAGQFDVSHEASIVFQNSVHIEFAFAIGLE
jgi:hypothetical protein